MTPAARPARPTIGEAREHASNGMLYIWEFVPGGRAPGWLRFDTWARGVWGDFPGRTASEHELRPLDRRALRPRLRGDGPTFARLTFE
jgi:hypothetical protein